MSSFLRAWFGNFQKEELKKYFFLGVIFAFIIGVYWTLRPMKDAIFGSLVVGYGKTDGREIFLALAKVISLMLLFPVVILYGKLVEKLKKDQFFYALTGFYAICMGVWAFFFSYVDLSNASASLWNVSGWLWYVFVESFGSLVIALFWAFTVDISTSHSARRGFPFIVMIGQLGGVLLPKYLNRIPRFFGTTSVPVILLCGFLTVLMMYLFRMFLKITPASQMEGFRGNEKASQKIDSSRKEPSLMEGLRLLLTHKYLLGIFAVLAFFEFIVTVIDFNFKSLVFMEFTNAASASEYLGEYGAAVNLVAFLCLFFGISNVQRRLGLRVALSVVPIIIGGAVMAFKLFPMLDVLFYLMIGAKAIGYALNSPSIKQLYIPTTEDVKYKSQAWIETFGSRSAKATASMANLSKGALGFATYLAITVYFSLGIAAIWFFIALFLARRCDRAVRKQELIC